MPRLHNVNFKRIGIADQYHYRRRGELSALSTTNNEVSTDIQTNGDDDDFNFDNEELSFGNTSNNNNNNNDNSLRETGKKTIPPRIFLEETRKAASKKVSWAETFGDNNNNFTATCRSQDETIAAIKLPTSKGDSQCLSRRKRKKRNKADSNRQELFNDDNFNFLKEEEITKDNKRLSESKTRDNKGYGNDIDEANELPLVQNQNQKCINSSSTMNSQLPRVKVNEIMNGSDNDDVALMDAIHKQGKDEDAEFVTAKNIGSVPSVVTPATTYDNEIVTINSDRKKHHNQILLPTDIGFLRKATLVEMHNSNLQPPTLASNLGINSATISPGSRVIEVEIPTADENTLINFENLRDERIEPGKSICDSIVASNSNYEEQGHEIGNDDDNNNNRQQPNHPQHLVFVRELSYDKFVTRHSCLSSRSPNRRKKRKSEPKNQRQLNKTCSGIPSCFKSCSDNSTCTSTSISKSRVCTSRSMDSPIAEDNDGTKLPGRSKCRLSKGKRNADISLEETQEKEKATWSPSSRKNNTSGSNSTEKDDKVNQSPKFIMVNQDAKVVSTTATIINSNDDKTPSHRSNIQNASKRNTKAERRKKKSIVPTRRSSRTTKVVTPLMSSSSKTLSCKRILSSNEPRNLSLNKKSKTEKHNIRVLITGIKVTQRYKQMVENINGVLLENIEDASRATHIIAGDKSTPLRRTPKLMIGLCTTSNILHLNWLIKSSKARIPLHCEDFLLTNDKIAEKKHKFSMKKTLERGDMLRRGGKRLFTDWHIFFCHGVAGFKAPPENELRLIVEAAGASWLPSLSPEFTKNIDPSRILVIIASDPNPAKRKKLSSSSSFQQLDNGNRRLTTACFFHAIINQKLPFD